MKAQEQSKPADSFVESIGIGDRFDWLNDDGLLPNAQKALSNLNIRYIRVGIAAESGSSTYITNTKNMASELGIQLCIVTDVYNTWSTQQSWLDSWRGYAGSTAVEGPNEVGVNATVAGIQQSIWNYAHPLGMEVYAWTLGAQAGYYRTDGIANGGNTVDDYCDYLNFHPYHWYSYNYSACKMNGLWQNGDFNGLGFGTSGCINQVRSMADNPSKPFVSTEFGWCINGLEQGVDVNFAKKYIVRNCFENFNSGMHRGFIFSLTNYAGAGADYALANANNGSLNATGQALANTISILQEPGQSNFAASSLNYSLTGISGTAGNTALTFSDDKDMQNDEIHHTLLQKSSGVFYLILWSDYDSHNGEDGWAQNATLNLPNGASNVKVYIPMNDTAVVKDYGSVAKSGSIALNTANGTAIPDHPIIIAITDVVNDITLPSQPSNLNSSSITLNSFSLAWSASTDNVGVTGYEVFKGGASVGTTTSTNMSITELTCATTYAMTVKARDAAGNWSAANAVINATTLACANTDMNIADENSKLSIYPIPTTDVLNFNNLPSEKIVYEIFSMEGKAIKAGSIMGKSIAIDDLQKGMYFIKIISDGKNGTLRFVKE